VMWIPVGQCPSFANPALILSISILLERVV
jgi:hypothetical protein